MFALGVLFFFVTGVMTGSVASHGGGEGDDALTLVLMGVCKGQSVCGRAFPGRLQAEGDEALTLDLILFAVVLDA